MTWPIKDGFLRDLGEGDMARVFLRSTIGLGREKISAQEALRAAYRPKKVRMLFIGESPPASGRFFYQGDSGLYRAVRDAFCAVDSSITDENFLSLFKDAGCFLIDLCGRPVDKLEPTERRAACKAGEPALSGRIRDLQPVTIVCLVRSIEKSVERAIEQAAWEGTLLTVPYPGRWIHHRREFLRVLQPHLKELLNVKRP
jgi:hypothetical protein